MAISILNNIPALAAENQLSITQANLNQTLQQLASGSRINTGADDAAGLAIADGLQANVTALTQSSLNATEGVGKLQVADGALSQVTSLLNRAVTLATESANGTVNDGSQRQALDAEFQSIAAEITRIGTNTTYNGSQIFTGGQTNVNQVTTAVTNPAGLAIADGLQANVTALTQSSLNATEGVGKLQVADGALSQVTTLLNRAVTLATESANGTVNDGTQRQALDAEFQSIKSEIDRIGTNTTYNGSAIFNGGTANYNQIVFSSATTGGLGWNTAITGQVLIKGGTGGTAWTFTSSASDATVGDLITDINTNGAGLVASLDDTGALVITDTKGRGVDSTSEVKDNTSTVKFGNDASATTGTSAPTNASSMNVFLSDSTSVGSSTISVALNQFDSGHMNGGSIANDDLLSATTAKTALSDINTAIAQVAALRGSIGAGINRLQAATNVMNNQTQNLSSAQDGIQAADITQTVANLTKYQILSQTGISALAQANQMQQGVLKLLQ